MKGYKPTVVFDFDGVIHSYKSGWKGAVVIPDPVVPGIVEAIDHLRAHGYRVVVVSTRCATSEGMEAVKDYLTENRIAVDDVLAEKPPAICYVDDRAVCFRGNAGKLVDQIKKFRSWVEDPKVQLMDCEVIKVDVSLMTDEEREKLAKKLADHPGTIEPIQRPTEQLRPCRAYRYERGGMKEVTGVFHCWGVNYQEFEDGPGNFTTALIEADVGTLYDCEAGSVQFLDRGPCNEERR